MPYDGVRMWGEVIVELRNARSGLIEKRVSSKNMLMSRLIDSIIGMTRNAWGVGGPGASDQRHAWYKFNECNSDFVFPPNQVTAVDYVDSPQILVLGTGSNAFTPASAGLTTPIVASYKNTYSSREGGTDQTTQDNIYLKLSRTYDTDEVNGIGINEVGLYGCKMYTHASALTIINAPYLDAPPSLQAGGVVWEVYNITVSHPAMAPYLYTFSREEATVTNNRWYFDRQNQVIKVHNNPAFLSQNDPIISCLEPDVTSAGATIPFVLGQFLAGLVLPETITKTVNHTLTIIWLIHFDRNPVCP